MEKVVKDRLIASSQPPAWSDISTHHRVPPYHESLPIWPMSEESGEPVGTKGALECLCHCQARGLPRGMRSG